MDWNAFLKSIFLSSLLAIGLFFLLPKSCNTKPIADNSDSLKIVIEKYQKKADSLVGVANKLDSLLKVKSTQVSTTSNGVIQYVTIYRTKHDTIEKLIACDSLASYAESLVKKCYEQDSLHIEKEIALSGAIDQIQLGLDTCQKSYDDISKNYENQKDKTVRNRRIAIVSSSIAVVEGLIIILLLK